MKKLAIFLALCMLVQSVGLVSLAEDAVPEVVPETVVTESAAEPEPAPVAEPEPEPIVEPEPVPVAEPEPEPVVEPEPEPVVEPEPIEEEPTEEPTAEPAEEPTEEPTAEPAEEPTEEPTADPTEEPTEEPTADPTEEPTEEPTADPTEEPTEEPTTDPTGEPTEEPTAEPTGEPTEEPTADPTEEPTEGPVEETEEEEAAFEPGLVKVQAGKKLYKSDALTDKIGELAEDAVVYADELNEGVLAVTYAAEDEAKKAYVAEEDAEPLTAEELDAWKKAEHTDSVSYEDIVLEAAVFVIVDEEAEETEKPEEEPDAESAENAEGEVTEEESLTEEELDESLMNGLPSDHAEFSWRAISPTTCEITECRSDSTDIVIPDSFTDGINTYKVTRLSDTTFARNTSITSVLLDSALSLSQIAPGCFEGCTSLRSISFAPGAPLDEIPDNAFRGCTNLASISWTTNMKKIGPNAFENCTSLTTQTLPNNLTDVGASAFQGCTGLLGISAPNSLQNIGKSAFQGCSAVINVLLNNGLKSIGDSAFSGCTSLKGIYIPNSVTYLGSSAFENCSSATELDLPTGIVEINNFTFRGCSSISNIIYMPSAITRVGREAFSGCSNIHTVYLTDSIANLFTSNINSVGAEAFKGLASDAVIFIPNYNAVLGVDALAGVRTVVGWYGSYAENYCKNHQPIEFVPLDTCRFIDFVYSGFLSRHPDSPSLIRYCRELALYGMTAGEFCGELLDSNEFKNVNTTDAAMVNAVRTGMMNPFYGTPPGYPTQLEGELMLRDGVSIKYVAQEVLKTIFFRDSVCVPALVTRGYIDLKEPRDQNRNTTAFVARCYIYLMGRARVQDEPAGLNYWTGRLLTNQETGATIVANFLRSQEWADQVMMGLSQQDQVNRLYLTMMERDALASGDPGLPYWLSILNTDFVSIEYIAKEFVRSLEFDWVCRRYGISTGTFALVQPRDKNIDVTRFVARCYTKALGRNPDVQGLNYWCDALLARRVRGAAMVKDFVLSFEMMQDASKWNLSNTAPGGWVGILYNCYLNGRTYESPAVLAYWNTQAAISREAVVDAFAETPEFKEILDKYGIQ